jgi:hypothetical protein
LSFLFGTALSSTKAEYITLSTTMYEVILLLHLLKEVQEQGLPINLKGSTSHCEIFEDTSGALEMARVPKMHPQTKHINLKYNYFLEHISSGILSLHAVELMSKSLTFSPKLYQSFHLLPITR